MPYPLKLRGAGIAPLVLLVAVLGVRPAAAAGSGTNDTEDPKPMSGGDGADKATSPPPAVPQVQVEDEGPSARVARKVRGGVAQPSIPEDADEKPFWKSWIFWSVTGAIVAGAVGAVIYSTSGTRGSVGPCPADVALSLGCYGAGRK
ncbi:MAG TPA: hypothetical protein VIU64_12680 [Polyangia bacterium]